MRRKQHSEAQRFEILRLLGKRTCSLSQFAREHGIAVPTLYSWQKKYKPIEEVLGTFVEIDPPLNGTKTPTKTSLLTIRQKGVELSFDSLPDAVWLAALVQNLHL